MDGDNPSVVMIAGPNGAGKSTAAPKLLADTLGILEFVNADAIALGLSAFNPAGAAVQAGRAMLARLHSLADRRVDFAFETTLAGKGFAPWVSGLRRKGYVLRIMFFWLPSPELAEARVLERVRAGGHDVPADTIRRRYRAGLRNFFQLYRPLADDWRFYDNSAKSGARLLASGKEDAEESVIVPDAWESIKKEAEGAGHSGQ